MVGEVKGLEESINISHKEMISIPWEEYKELLMIKGRYEELKERNNKPNYNWGVDWGVKESTSVPIRELSNPISYYQECPKIEVKEI